MDMMAADDFDHGRPQEGRGSDRGDRDTERMRHPRKANCVERWTDRDDAYGFYKSHREPKQPRPDHV